MKSYKDKHGNILYYKTASIIKDNLKCDVEHYTESWKQWFNIEKEKYYHLSEELKEEYREKYYYLAFQFDYIISFPESTLKEQNRALYAEMKGKQGKGIPKWFNKLTQKS